VCGGTFSSRNRKKRKAKPNITYKEQKERRIRRKFGTNGVTLGADDEQKAKLEKGKRPAGKPRVAGSARGRELRAAAALSRFEAKEEPQIKDEELVTDSEAESEAEDEVFIKAELADAVDINGDPLLDLKGGGMVKVCEDEDDDDGEDAKEELSDFRSIAHTRPSKPAGKSKAIEPAQKPPSSPQSKLPKSLTPSVSRTKPAIKPEDGQNNEASSASREDGATACSVCSVENERNALTCIVCSNVLQPEFVANSWKCKSSTW
jgi:hypothetical protein